MILEARTLDMGTRDVAPQPGEVAWLQRHTERESVIMRVVAHWPVLGIWEVVVTGVRKPAITVSVRRGASDRWQEITGR